jgi:hypothetical protein
MAVLTAQDVGRQRLTETQDGELTQNTENKQMQKWKIKH